MVPILFFPLLFTFMLSSSSRRDFVSPILPGIKTGHCRAEIPICVSRLSPRIQFSVSVPISISIYPLRTFVWNFNKQLDYSNLDLIFSIC